MALSMEQLMPLTEASPLLDQVEEHLRNSGEKAAAYALRKLQQDAGIELEKEFGIYDPAAGPETAKLDRAYKEVTPERLNIVLQKANASLPPDLKSALDQLIKTVLPQAAQAPSRPQKLAR